MGKLKIVADGLKKIAKDKVINYLEDNFPSYNRSSKSIRIPEKNLQKFMNSKCKEIPEIEETELKCQDGFIDLDVSGSKSIFTGTINIKCFIERFEINKNEQVAELRFETKINTQNNGIFNKMALFLTEGLILGTIQKKFEAFSETEENKNLIDVKWPNAKIFLSGLPIFQKMVQKEIIGYNFLDVFKIDSPTVKEGFVELKPHFLLDMKKEAPKVLLNKGKRLIKKNQD